VPSIWELDEVVKGLSKESREVFDRIYEYYVEVGTLKLPDEIRDWAKNRFGECERQRIVRVFNRFTFESTLFNELRAKRPIDAKDNADLKEVIESSKGDYFCSPDRYTPCDEFGRIEGKHCITAANIAKYDYLHAVLVFKKHDPFSFSEEEVVDYIETALRWMKKANEFKKDAVYPFFLWNCLWKAGASIIHGHAQVLLSKKPYSKWLFFKKVRETYRNAYERDYAEDLSHVHRALGLLIEKGNTKVMAYLTPIKEKEVLIFAENPLEAGKTISWVLRGFYSLGVRSFNVGMYLPALGEEDLVMVRIVDRGDPASKTVDMGGMEVYAGTSVVSSDPFKLIEFLNKFE